MLVTRKQIQDAFELLFRGILDPEFSKSLRLETWGEKALLPLVRTYLLGYFRNPRIEVTSKFPWNQSGKGRLDFCIGNVAVEFAVRIKGKHPRVIGLPGNYPEIVKLTLHEGPALLILFDFAKKSLERTELDCFRQVPSPGQGNFNKSGYSVMYYHRSLEKPIRMNVVL